MIQKDSKGMIVLKFSSIKNMCVSDKFLLTASYSIVLIEAFENVMNGQK
jgi:hypothetical protein